MARLSNQVCIECKLTTGSAFISVTLSKGTPFDKVNITLTLWTLQAGVLNPRSENPRYKTSIGTEVIFKIYPSPFTSSPQHSFHIFFIGDIFLSFGDILLSIGDYFLSIGVIFLSFGDIFRMISWYFLYFISRIHANRTNRIGRKRKCCIFATSIRSNNEMQDC